MISHAPKNDESRPLIDAAMNGTITVGQAAELQTLLENDAETCRLYAEYARIEAELHLLIRARAANQAVSREIGFPAAGGVKYITPEPSTPALSGGFLHGTFAAFSQTGPLSYLIATLVMGAMLLGAWAYKISHVNDPHIVDNIRRSTPSAPSDHQEFVFVGHITGMKDCRWSDPDTQTYIGTSVALDREYALLSGLMEISYKSGAKVILEGPCTYKVDSDAGGFLAAGKLTARVEKKGSGFGVQDSKHSPLSTHHSPLFAVRTPTAIITDLGTEFGVEVAANGDTTSYVFEGKIVVKAGIRGFGDSGVRDSDKRPATAVAGVDERELEAGESIRVSRVRETHQDSTTTETVRFTHPTETPKFIRSVPSPRDQWNAEAARYAEMVLTLGPVAYYRMETPADRNDSLVVFDSADGARHGKISSKSADGGLAKLWNPRGRFGGALQLRGDYYGDYVVAPRPPDSTSGQLTFSAWVLSDIRGLWCVVVNEGGSRYNCRFKIAQRKDDADICAWVAPNDPEPDEMVEVREGVDSPLPYGSWQHIALVADGETVRLYRNGVEVSSSPCNGVTAHPPGKYLVLGATNWSEDPAGLEVHSHWSGLIDEVAVFDRALSPEEVERLYDSAGKGTRKSHKQTNGSN